MTGFALQVKGCRADQSGVAHFFGDDQTALQRMVNFRARKRCAVGGDKAIAQVTVILQIAGRAAGDGRVIRQVDGVCDQSRGDICLCCCASQNRDAVGDTQRQAPPPTARSGDAANPVTRGDLNPAQIATFDRGHGRGEPLPRCQMQRDIASVVHIGTTQRRSLTHGVQNLIRDRPRHGSHWCHKRPAMRTNCTRHATSNTALKARAIRCHGLAQLCEFANQFLQNRLKPRLCGLERRLSRAICPDDQVNRPVLQMQPGATGQYGSDGLHLAQR